MTTVFGEHRGKKVEIQFDPKIAEILRDREQRILDKAKSSGMKAKFQASVDAWNQILRNPSLLNLVDEFAEQRKLYLDHALYSETGFDAMFQRR